MNKINYHDIDFNELAKLNVESSESSIYVDKNRKRLYKIFKTNDIGELLIKSEKLDLLVQKNHIKRMHRLPIKNRFSVHSLIKGLL